MAINQAEIFTKLEKLHANLDKNEFIYDFLTCFGYAPATITLLKKGDRNVSENPQSGEVALKNGVYFKPLMIGEDIYEMAERLKNLSSIRKNKIRFIFVTDFLDLIAYDLKANDPPLDCSLASLHENYSYFLPLAGYEKASVYEENEADVKAAEQMGRLFDLIKEKNKSETAEDIHGLNVFLTRLLFCFFAEDTGIFEKNQMTTKIDSVTNPDGSDVSIFFENLFEILNEPEDSQNRHQKAAHFKSFPYVNGGLFKTKFPIPEFTSKARRILIDCGTMQWEDINPDIFGSMFQSVIDEDQRGNLGQHYTSVTNIMKVIQPLFLDKLHEELEKSRGNSDKLKALIDRIAKIKIFDPACGSGNFLIIAYKELRKIEMAAFRALDEVSSQKVMFMSGVRLSQFYGIEIDDFAHEIALLSLWLTEHQMNQAFQAEFGYSPPSLPLKESGNIIADNSLKRDWNEVCPKTSSDEVYVCGNPPFLGFNSRSESQTSDQDLVLKSLRNSRKLDYVSCWIFKGASYIQHSAAELAFVSTSSITQGVQVEMLWPVILDKSLKIHFAYRGFPWKNNAKDNAGVHVAIIGLTANLSTPCRLFKQHNKSWLEEKVKNISPYLLEGNNVVIAPRSKPFSKVIMPMTVGSYSRDDGNLLLTRQERDSLLKAEPKLERWLKKAIGAEEFLKGKERFCLWLDGISPNELADLKILAERIENVKKTRLESTSESTRAYANEPHLFTQRVHPINGNYILVPTVSSERRNYLPVGFFNSETVCIAPNMLIPGGTFYEAGILMSSMHMDWLRLTAGRLKSDYRYSPSLVYNTFPWLNLNDSQKENISKLTENIFLVREHHPEKTISQMYDPEKMPADLLKAHQDLDNGVEKLYREKPFKDGVDRLQHLLLSYEKLVTNSNITSK